jgi:hypothetical protein
MSEQTTVELQPVDVEKILGIDKDPELSSGEVVKNALNYLSSDGAQSERILGVAVNHINGRTQAKSSPEQIGAILKTFYDNKDLLPETDQPQFFRIVGQNIGQLAEDAVRQPYNPKSEDVEKIIADPNDLFQNHGLSEAVKEGMREGLLIQTP